MGFQTFPRPGIVLQVGTNPEIPIDMRIGDVSDRVVVEATASEVETRTAGVGTTVVDSQKILDLPLNGRQATDLIPLAGLAVTTSSSQPTYTMKTGPSVSVAGGMRCSVQYNLDSAPHVNTSTPLPFPDALQSSGFPQARRRQPAGAIPPQWLMLSQSQGPMPFMAIFSNSSGIRISTPGTFFSAGGDGLKRNQSGGVVGGRIIKETC